MSVGYAWSVVMDGLNVLGISREYYRDFSAGAIGGC
jgi:hypothetical protein